MALTKRKHPEGDVTTQILKITFQVFQIKNKNFLLESRLLIYSNVVTL